MKKEVVSKRTVIISVAVGIALAASLSVLFRPAIVETVSGQTDLGRITTEDLAKLEKEGLEGAAVIESAAPAEPGVAQPVPESMLRVPKGKK